MRVSLVLIGAGLLGRPAAAKPVFKEVAHYFGYDSIQAANAGAAASAGLDSVIGLLESLDTFKPIMYPAVVSALDAAESATRLIRPIFGWLIGLVVRFVYSSSLLNDTPYIGELIRAAESAAEIDFQSGLSSLDAELASMQTVASYI
ncbi:hypothetical protein H4R18_002022 [Coemansia javaensis]|uniref:Uncharacterized protein n=1 Tax=Coemansia javaensis TaxID=2761396 RepID=A0A9W8LJS0_9FUNG|nr:hypothetical protein H4R18_002022 [Coemansia javaensis]